MSPVRRLIACFVLIPFLASCSAYREIAARGPGDVAPVTREVVETATDPGDHIRVTLTSDDQLLGRIGELNDVALVIEESDEVGGRSRSVLLERIRIIEKRSTNVVGSAIVGGVVVASLAVLVAALMLSGFDLEMDWES